MAFNVISHIKKKASQFTCGSLLYDWSLYGHVPERLMVKPVDPWPGDAGRGRWLCEGAFDIEGDQLAANACWEPPGVSVIWLDHMHGFSWLRDLRALGGDMARRQARGMVGHWINRYSRWDEMTWRPDLTGRRLSMWIALYEFFGASAEDDFQDFFFSAVMRQARHLQRALTGKTDDVQGIGMLYAIQGLLYSGVAFGVKENWVGQALSLLEQQIDIQVLHDGGHVSRSPAQLIEALQIMLDIRGALAAAEHGVPEKLSCAIESMGNALRFFRYADKGLCVLGGAQEGNIALMDIVLGQAGIRGKTPHSLPSSGYERVALGRTCLMVDTGKTPFSPFDQSAHVAPLAFEMLYGKDRVFVSCGTHPTDPAWQEALRATAAHNTLCLDNRNVGEIREDGHISRGIRNIVSVREDLKNAVLLEASHDGYVPLNGITHARRIYLSDKGNDIRGEDTLSANAPPVKPHNIAIRFHLHPRVKISLIQEGEAALLRLPCGTGWRFQHDSGHLALENSVYLGSGTRPAKTKQLVIYGQTSSAFTQIKWGLRKEG